MVYFYRGSCKELHVVITLQAHVCDVSADLAVKGMMKFVNREHTTLKV